MGSHDVSDSSDEKLRLAFTKALLDDLSALEHLLEGGGIESGVRRIGAEQELFLVDRALQPASVAEEVLARLSDPRFTTELARFNLEANLTPISLGGSCLRAMEEELEALVQAARRAAAEVDADILLTGILPTLKAPHLKLEHMTPHPRYLAMNRALTELRCGDFQVDLRGIDELQMAHDNVMLEACNTSFQVHFQVDPEGFPQYYNLAQAITAPVLAAAVNSPLLLGQRLWHETRVALFQSAVDERSEVRQRRGHPSRVGFGDGWVEASVLELFREDVTRQRVILVNRPEEPATAQVERGEVPKLRALGLHNGTVWRWNRACYGVTEGRAHLRIENRVLPSGPTLLDEVANAAFFIGLLCGGIEAFGDVRKILRFDDARDNFVAAARYGLKSRLTWEGGRVWGADALILEVMLPMARTGLLQAGIDGADIDRYLGTIEARVRSGRTGAQWMLDSLAGLGEQRVTDEPGGQSPPETRHRAVTAAMLERQKEGIPVHRWPLARLEEAEHAGSYQTVGQFMSTDLFTVRPEDLVDLAAHVMDWKHVKYVPVEDDGGHLLGLVSHRELFGRLVGRAAGAEPVPVRSIMVPEPVRVTPDTSALEALRIMRREKVGCLLVVEGEKLVGIVTAADFLELTARMLEGGEGRPQSSSLPQVHGYE